MTFVSYAQNFEDVMLWRVFKHVQQGFYIDVGAADPDTDSITRAFYDRGWNGINVEPVEEYARRLRAARVRDTTLQIALGESTGLSPFCVVNGTGLSAMGPDSTSRLRETGFPMQRVVVDVDTLAAVCRRHAPADIHFLKIDVEGSEGAVLAGADFSAHRPWIVLVEATAPMSTTETHTDWEHILLDAAYRFVWFDGLNRFYVASERYDQLSMHFRTPVNVFDDFLRVADTEWARRIHQAETHVAELRERCSYAESQVQAADSRASAAYLEMHAAYERADAVRADLRAALHRAEVAEIRLEQSVTAKQAEIAEMRAAVEARLRSEAARTTALQAQELELDELRKLVARVEAQREEIDRAARETAALLDATLVSTSWRLTAPLRAVATLIGVARLRHQARKMAVNPLPATQVQIIAPNPEPTNPANVSTLTQGGPTPARAIRAVHQFHSGSAVGDAITNAMLLMQRMLHSLGYESEIFVQHRDPRLADCLFEMEDLPSHSDYILVVHHSMGYDACEQIASLPARKILVYHNITPPEFLADFPEAIPYAELGRRQLSLLRPHMAAAIADSDFNALELRGCGYEAPVACPILFDVDQLIANAKKQATRSDDLPFTVLFVGRLVASKGQADLVDAFAQFRRLFGAPCRLVLVGRMAAPDAAYPTEVQRRIDLHGIREEVLITGSISDEDLHNWYRIADLYVSLSLHEGFGVPLVEAMANEVPVIAWPAGAVPYTLCGAGELLADRTPETTAAAMLKVAKDANRRAEIVARQREVLDRFRMERQMPKLVGAVMGAGAAPPDNQEAREAVARNLLITVTGHVNGTYSLAVVNRTLALALEDRRPGTTRIAIWENGPTGDLSGVPAAQKSRVAALAARPQPPSGPEIVISQHYPVHIPQYRGDRALAMVFWEESLLPEATVEELNRGFDGILAPSRFAAKSLVDSGVSVPVTVVGYAPHLEAFEQLALGQSPEARDPDRPFTFLHVSSCFPRKGVDVLLGAFQQAFGKTDPVRLVIKGFPNPHNDSLEQVERLRDSDPDLPDIEVINEDFNEQAMLDLYRQADVVVLPTRGEGFNIPAAEALAAGIPLIVTGYGGHLDFCGPDDARFINYHFAPSKSHLATPGSVWVEPDETDLVTALRQAVADFRAGGGDVAAKSIRARQAIRQRLDSAAWADRLNSAAVNALVARPQSALRIAAVSTWGIRCGIAEYSRFLLEPLSLSDRCLIDRLLILCDDRTAPSTDGGIRVRPTWRLKDSESIERLARTIAVEDPHVVLIQHQPGLIQWSDLARLLRDRRVRNRVSVVTLHAAARLLEVGEEERGDILAALRQASRVLVHQVADLNLLTDLGGIANVSLFPQGTPPRFPAPAARLLRRQDTPVIGSYGFFLPGKGLPRLIEAGAQLRRKWPKLRLTLVNAEYPATTSHEEIVRCRALANSLGLDDAVEWDTEFHPHEESMRRLSRCDLLILPYDESGESSSAALRSAMASGVPVAVTPIALFRDASSAVHCFPSGDSSSIAEGIDRLLRDQDARVRYQKAAAAWLEECSWDKTARRLRGMLLGLRASMSCHSGLEAD